MDDLLRLVPRLNVGIFNNFNALHKVLRTSVPNFAKLVGKYQNTTYNE